VPGRRHFFRYRDLRVAEATGGKMRAQVTSAKSAMDRATGWHYHTCEMLNTAALVLSCSAECRELAKH
jgi:hypothetical protein